MIRGLLGVLWYGAKVWRHDGFATLKRALRDERGGGLTL
jgi:hypothetical protein